MPAFQTLSQRHKTLLELQGSPPEDFAAQINEFLKQLAQGGREVYDTQQRDQLRGYLRYWSSALFQMEPSQGYQTLELEAFAGKAPAAPNPGWIIGGLVVLLAVALLIAIRMGSELSGAAATPTDTATDVAASPPATDPFELIAQMATQTAQQALSIQSTPVPFMTATSVAALPPTELPTLPPTQTPAPVGAIVQLTSPANGAEIYPELEFSGTYAGLRPGWSIHVVVQPLSKAGLYYPLAEFFTVPDSPNEAWSISANLADQFDIQTADTYIITLVAANTEQLRSTLVEAASTGLPSLPAEAIAFSDYPVTVTRKGYRVVDEYRLLFTIYKENTFEIYSARLDGSDAQRLTFDSQYRKTTPSVSPDGAQIAYAAWQNDPDNPQKRLYSLWVMQSNGQNQTMLLSEAGMIYEQPLWSPNGRSLVFAQKVDQQSYSYDLYLLDLTSPGQAVPFLITEPATPEGEWVESRYPWWKSATEVIYTRRTARSMGIYLVNIDTRQSRKFIDFPGLPSQAVISPDGQQIAFVDTQRDTYNLGVYAGALSENNFTQVTKYEELFQLPRWGPDNQTLFVTTYSPIASIWKLTVGENKVEKIDLGPDKVYDLFVGYIKAFYLVSP